MKLGKDQIMNILFVISGPESVRVMHWNLDFSKMFLCVLKTDAPRSFMMRALAGPREAMLSQAGQTASGPHS